MPHVFMSQIKGDVHNKDLKAKVLTFIQKLIDDDTSPGLHIEPMKNAADPRARTGRVDKFWRAVLYRLDFTDAETTYVYAGTWPHDDAIVKARTRILRMNPINGIAEFINTEMPQVASYVAPTRPALPELDGTPVLLKRSYTAAELTGILGFDMATAHTLLSIPTEGELLSFAETLVNQWQIDAVLGLAVGDSVSSIRDALGIGLPAADAVASGSSTDDRLKDALLHPAARMQFALIENDEELRHVLDEADFAAWRVFLHPEQRLYATKNYSGAFRLSGGAGTGKTVVLIHRAHALAATTPDARIVLTTFTTALSSALERDLERLDPSLPRATELGGAGVLVQGIDALAASVRTTAGADFGTAAEAVLGYPVGRHTSVVGNNIGWREAIERSPDTTSLPEAVQSPSFLENEYLQVILPNRVTTMEEYFAVRRPGRGIALDRSKRAKVWTIVEQYRQHSRTHGSMSYAEIAASAAAYLEPEPSARADHVLVDEAQDLTPLHWQLLRALVAEGPNDLFIAEDTHQRIYGQPVVLSRIGIKIIGRSRRMTLNYRTTQQNLRYAMGLLAGADYVDSEQNAERQTNYRSARTGPVPRVISAQTVAKQFDNVADVVSHWVANEDIRPETIAILARSNKQATDLKARLNERGVVVALSHSGDSRANLPVVMTMHKAKGMEFSRVLLFDVSEGSIPNKWALQDVPPEEISDALLRERSLLYVAASRARDELVVSWHGKASPLLSSALLQ
jgi:superfamily I DNA/RNA helicase